MTDERENGGRPECFGTWEKVFPFGEDGLRSVAPECAPCPSVQPCLKAAAHSPAGLEARAGIMEAWGAGKGRRAGVRGFLARWSELKSMKAAAGKKKD
jgi:hypothetical protein